jgi:hypothetical protein
MMLIAGCGQNPSRNPTAIAAHESTRPLTRAPSGAPLEIRETEFDFGVQVAHGQTLRHEFTLTNTSEQRVTLVDGQALTPCCSSIQVPSKIVEPGEIVRIPIEFRTGERTGRNRLEFVVRAVEQRPWSLGLAIYATLVPEIEIAPREPSDASLILNRAGFQRFRVTSRRLGDIGRDAPESIASTDGVDVRFEGPEHAQTDLNGMTIYERDILVRLPASPKPGSRRASFELKWPDGRRREHAITWNVAALIRASPAGIVLKPSDGRCKRSIALYAPDVKFAVAGVSGSLLADTPALTAADAKLHKIELDLDPARLEKPGATDIVFRTNHPDQPTIAVSVMVLPPQEDAP